MLLGYTVGVERHDRTLVKTVERVRRVAAEQPDLGGLAVLPGQPGEIAVGIHHQGRDQRPVVEVFLQRKHELVVLEVRQEDLEARALTGQKRLDGRVVVLAPTARMDEVHRHTAGGGDQLLEPRHEGGEGVDPEDLGGWGGDGAHRAKMAPAGGRGKQTGSPVTPQWIAAPRLSWPSSCSGLRSSTSSPWPEATARTSSAVGEARTLSTRPDFTSIRRCTPSARSRLSLSSSRSRPSASTWARLIRTRVRRKSSI